MVCQVEEEYRVEKIPVHWYVVSDCSTLRHKAAKMFGQKVTTVLISDL